MTKERRKIVERVREEGREAFRQGKSFFTNPYRDLDAYQWSNGYMQEEELTDAGCKK